MATPLTVAAHLRLCSECSLHNGPHATIVLANGELTMNFSSKQAGYVISETLFEVGKLTADERIAVDREISESPLAERTSAEEIKSLKAQFVVGSILRNTKPMAVVVVDKTIAA